MLNDAVLSKKNLIFLYTVKKSQLKNLLIFTFLLLWILTTPFRLCISLSSLKGFCLHQQICFIIKHAGRFIKKGQETLKEDSTIFMLKNCSLYYQTHSKTLYFQQD